ncbi:hypothetical protein RJ640_006091 [Escallonia rubra]|uniref:Phytocyanin domain-containing protein n=1 Tax=Escallonia rubra TaxID=112253 RepID=A0AA88RTX4_9ASTE|nr:hypothetical protein RJ640_006091 [Escallonia rubra]
MAGRLSLVVFMVMVVAAMQLQSSKAATHVVGGSIGWLVPPGGSAAYSTWAASQTFVVGDVLVFNFTTGQHDVAEVSKAAFDSCNATSPISMVTNGPANITLTAAGEHHFICTFSRHCGLGQKLAINVSASAPPPRTTPTSHVVGDALGWLVPPGGSAAYATWASTQTFIVGDILVFNFTTGQHDVAEVTKAAFDSCNTTSPISMITDGPANITLTTAGEHHFICTFSRHCGLGQKLAINVSSPSSTSPSPSPQPATPPPSSPPSPTPSPATPPSPNHTPSSSPAPAPSSMATPPSSSATPPPSSSATPPPSPSAPSPVSPTPPSETAPPPPNSAPSFAAAALPVSLLSVALAFLPLAKIVLTYHPMTRLSRTTEGPENFQGRPAEHTCQMATPAGLIGCLIVVSTLMVGATANTFTVLEEMGWRIPDVGDIMYKTWAAQKDFELGDVLVFNWNGTHNVAKVTKEDYDNCNSTNVLGSIQTTSPANFTLDINGSNYFICTVGNHCSRGQKVTATIETSAAVLTTATLSTIVFAMAIAFLTHL